MTIPGANPFPPELVELYTARRWWSGIPLGQMLDRTGDLVRFDPQGRMTITGRKKDVIIRGGENISAREVEELVAGHPAVDLAAVVGMPDPVLGERVCAFIKPKPGEVVTFEDVIAFLKSKNTSVLYLPERVEIVPEIPLTPVGKIDKKKLREDIRVKIESETAPDAR